MATFFIYLNGDCLKKINYDVIKDNLEKLNKKTILVVKDDAYGCGMKNVVRLAVSLGFIFFAVAEVSDAIYIVNNYQGCYVLILGKNRVISSSKRIFLTVESEDDYLFCKSTGMPFHFKLIGSMNRFGMKKNKNIINDPLCKGVYMHLSRYDDIGLQKEMAYFESMVSDIKNKIIHVGGSHILNKNDKYIKRVGMAIYNNAIEMYAKVIKIFNLPKDSYLGYNRSYYTHKNIKVGIIDIGYNCGLSSKLYHRVYIRGQKYKMIGKKCMDFSFVQIDDRIKCRDVVEVIGNHIKIDEVEKIENKDRYELYVNLK